MQNSEFDINSRLGCIRPVLWSYNSPNQPTVKSWELLFLMLSSSSSKVQKLMLLLHQCSDTAALRCAHALVIVNGLAQSFTLVAKLLGLCSSLSASVAYASSIFSEVHRPNVFLWNSFLKAYSKSDNPLQAIFSYRRFCCLGFRPDCYSFPPLFDVCRELSAMIEGLQVHVHVLKTGFGSNLCVQTQLLRFYAQCGGVVSARLVFDEMYQWGRDAVAWTAMIDAYASESGDVTEAFRLFKAMPFERDAVCRNAMIVGFIRWGEIAAARELFIEFSGKDVACWTSMISGYAHIGEYREALNLFSQMRLSDSKPNCITLVSALSSCAHLGAIRIGMSIHEYIEKNGIYLDVYIGTTLIDMYSKCGNIESSMKVFDLMPQKDIYCWNTMIEGLAVHGLGCHALEMFSDMQDEGFEPNEITFVGILMACSHMGLVKEGQFYFDSMINQYGIAPRIEHYGCMVDLLGRAGLIERAEELVNTMPIEPNAVIWGALVSACRVAGNVELGERVVKHLLDFEPQNSSNYILLSNIYAAENRWDDAEKVRKMLRCSGVKKIHGFSSIEVGGVVCEFVQGDRLLSKDIYQLLDDIAMKLKDMGHIPGIKEIFHDIEKEEREYALSGHSEKSAIVFQEVHSQL